MYIQYLPANQAYTVVFGDSLVMIAGKCLWQSKADLVAALRQINIVVAPDSKLELMEVN